MTAPILSPELQAIEREHQRKVQIVEARPILRRVAFVFVLVVDIVMIMFFAYVLVGYVVADSFTELRSAAAMKNNVASMHAIAQGSQAKEPTIGSAKVIQGTPTSYDFFTTIKNANADWYATFTYQFHSGSISSREEKGFVMPGESKYLLSLGVVAENRPASPSVVVDNLVWHRVNRHSAPNVSAWLAQHGSFIVTTPTYAADIALATDNIGRTTWTVTNASAYSYWAPKFTVVLERAGAVVGVTQATFSEFLAGEKRDGEVRWYGEIPVTATATVTPEVNYFDESHYMSPQGDTQTDPRD